MIDERTLTDATRCPSCAGPLPGVTTCPTCGVSLAGPTAHTLWDVSVRAAGLLGERSRLIATLRAEAAAAQPATSAWARTASPAGPAAPAAAARPAPVGRPSRPAPEWTRRKVQNLLLALGVGLLAVAAVVFLIVSWSVLGIGGRAAVMTGCTVLACGGATLARRRGLGSTAEAVSLLTVALALLDAVGARSAGLAGLDDVDGLLYWAGAFAVVAAAAAGTAAVVPTRSFRVAGAVLGQLPLLLLTAHVADGSDRPAAVTATGCTVAALAAVALAAGWPFGTATRDARVVIAVGAGLSWLAASGAALGAAYLERGSVVPGTVLLLVLAAVAAGAVLVGDRLPALPTAGVTASAALVVAAAWAVPADRASATWLPTVLSLSAVALLLAALLVPRRHRTAPVLVALVASVAPGLTALVPVGATVLGQLGWLDRPWQAQAQASARQLLDGVLELGAGASFTWGPEVPALLLCAAVSLAVADRLHAVRPVGLLAVPVAALAAVTLPVGLDSSGATALAVELALAAVLLPVGCWLLRQAVVAWGTSCAATGVVVLGLAVAWSLARQPATLVSLPVAALLLAGAAVLVGHRFPAVRLALGVATGLTVLGDAAALARAGGAGWPAVWSLVLGLSTLLAAGAAVRLDGHVRRGFVLVATASLLGAAVALTTWGGGTPASAGLALTMTAGVLAVTAVWADTLLGTSGRTPSPVLAAVGADVAATAVAGAVLGLAVSSLDAERLWLALLAAGVAAAVLSFRSDLHRVGWLAGLLLAASSWVRLVLSDVDAPEPYTVPAGVALIALGLWRRHREPTYPSWRAYGTGLGLALVPSLVRALVDSGNVRPVLLLLAALVVLCSGIVRRLQAPLVIGGAVLAVDAIVQLSPYLVAVYDAVPRWTLIAGAGLLLLTIGATYERRAQEIRALHQQIARFG